MSLKKKIILSFLISAFIIAVLAAFEYINFIQIKNEIRFLETTDTIRSKSLQLRRHEKNYFLTGDVDEVKSVHDYLKQVNDILAGNRYPDSAGGILNLKKKADEYGKRFNHIENIVYDFRNEFDRIKPLHRNYSVFFKIIETTFLERPVVNADLMKSIFKLGEDNTAVRNLYELDSEISTLRKNGEEILIISKELDKIARKKVDGFIRRSQIAILISFTVFLITGAGAFLYVTGNVVRRLHMLTALVEKTGGGVFSKISVGRLRWNDNDEIGVLIEKFNSMEEQLIQREKELYQSKKLAAIGTLASGVAHELNNPLNNIYTTAQRLLKKSGEECPASIKKGLDDIFGQTMRVKSIVSDLIEFARGRELNIKPVELRSLLTGVYRQLGTSIDTSMIRFILEFRSQEIVIYADKELLERVFINLFANAIDAISGEGDITVRAEEKDMQVRIQVSDTGRGMSRETVDKIFEPFFTTKDKGTGLGLAIVFNIIQKHQGEITVESEEGRGTTFIITLPRSAVNG